MEEINGVPSAQYCTGYSLHSKVVVGTVAQRSTTSCRTNVGWGQGMRNRKVHEKPDLPASS